MALVNVNDIILDVHESLEDGYGGIVDVNDVIIEWH